MATLKERLEEQQRNVKPERLPAIELFTMGETAKVLRISKSYLGKLVQRGEIKGIKQGIRIYFREKDISDYLVACVSSKE